MVIMHEVTIPTKTVQQQVGLECDHCHARSEGARDWGTHSYDVKELTLKFRSGEQYPEGGWGTETTIDLCPACWMDWLAPLLTSHGVTGRTVPWEW